MGAVEGGGEGGCQSEIGSLDSATSHYPIGRGALPTDSQGWDRRTELGERRPAMQRDTEDCTDSYSQDRSANRQLPLLLF